MFTDDAKAVIALTTRLGDSQRPSLSPTRWHRLATALDDAGLSAASVFDTDITAIPGVPDDLADAVIELLGDASVTTVAATDLERQGIWTLTIVDSTYPTSLQQRLGKNAPPVIFGVGDPAFSMRRESGSLARATSMKMGHGLLKTLPRPPLRSGDRWCQEVPGGSISSR